MKKKLILLVALACALMLSACADGFRPAASESAALPASSRPTQNEAVSSGSAESESAQGFELNRELFDLLKGDNADLKQMREGSCYAEIPGRGTARVLYFEPFLDVQMVPPAEGAYAAWREGYGEGHQTENPFVDDLPVLELTVEDEIDPLAPAVPGQDSLRQLFVTDALITYPLLCEHLGQTPELTLSETVYSNALSPESWPLANDPGQPIEGGDWRADFSVDELRLTVSFVQTEGEYVAWRATLSEE